MFDKLDLFHDQIILELLAQVRARPAQKDILVVVHDQLPHLRTCLESIIQNTRDYRLFVWDNASGCATRDYLRSLATAGQIHHLQVAPENQGFIEPNNRLYSLGGSRYVILLNSDTCVLPGWSEALVGYLQAYPEVALVGYQGSRVNPLGEGGEVGFGRDIDYVCGWAACLDRDATEAAGGLFDEAHLSFAYCEDSDLSFRLREAGYSIHALHLELVEHRENCTISEVHQELGTFVERTFARNHTYLRNRWGHFLPSLTKIPEMG